MKFVKVIQYRNGGMTVEFVPLQKKEMPGYSHRINITYNLELIAEDVLPEDQKINPGTAEHFYRKHIAKII